MHFSFFGIVEKYSGGVYYVRYLAGEKATSADMVFACRVGELVPAESEFVESHLIDQQDRYNQVLSAVANGRGHYYGSSQSMMLWASFAVKRIRDRDWQRKFPITNNYGRHDRVY
jgi:hypothetical protein|tara:strand:+ start:1126 stop:1470 length:345 start_codon:yes stop_codon:yes gene_type:complete